VIAFLLLAGGGGILPQLSALCPKPLPGEILVCADGESPRSSWRVAPGAPPIEGASNTASVSRERNALIAADNASSGSCSSVGTGGWTGCRHREFKRNVEQAAGQRDFRGRIFVQPR
jgi:hypothetical protein